MVWEQEIYSNFEYKKSRDYFYTFQAHVSGSKRLIVFQILMTIFHNTSAK